MTHQSKQSILSTLLILPILLTALSGCGLKLGGAPNFPDPVVTVYDVEAGVWPVTYTTAGTLEAQNKADLNMEVAGTIQRILVEEGQAVNRGQTLIRLKADKFNAQVQQAQNDLLSAREDVGIQDDEINRLKSLLKAAESRRHNAEHDYDRFKKLHQDQMISIQELDTKRLDFETADADYQAALSSLNAAKAAKNKNQAGLSRAKASLTYSNALANEARIMAPFSGRVGQKFVSVGDYVLPGEKVISIVDRSKMKIAFAVPEEYLGHLKPGLTLKAHVAGFEEQAFNGTLYFVDAIVDEQTRTVVAKAYLDDPNRILRHGQSASVTLTLNKKSDSIAIPEESLRLQGEKVFVYKAVYDEEKDIWAAADQEITIGQRHAGEVEVLSGLEEGDRVITSGYQKIRAEGTKVDIKDEQPEKTDAAEN